MAQPITLNNRVIRGVVEWRQSRRILLLAVLCLPNQSTSDADLCDCSHSVFGVWPDLGKVFLTCTGIFCLTCFRILPYPRTLRPAINTIPSSLFPRCPISDGPHLSPSIIFTLFPCDFKGVLEEKWLWTQPIVLNLESESKFLYKLTSTSFTSFSLFFLSHSKNFDFIFLSPLLLLQSITEKIVLSVPTLLLTCWFS